MESLLQKIQKNWEFYHLAVPSEKNKSNRTAKIPLQVVVCVSGGSDSVALFYLLHRLSSLLQLDLHILHFNHQLRPEANDEQNFVKSLADQNKIPFHYVTAKHLKTGQPGLQESAREWRIEESRKLLETIGGGRIATGHHADDQTETLLLKLLRGTHISNLQGMRWINTPFIRPLLNFRKSELQDYLKKNKLTWMEDASNQSAVYLRNRVRIELIPLLEELTRHGLHSRINDLSEQSQLLRKRLDSDYANWRKNRGNSDNDSSTVLSIADMNSAEDILLQEILHNFITAGTGMALSYHNLKKITELVGSASNLWELHLSQEWKISQSGKKLFLQLNIEK
ncbi:MAG TPA: tRNA lysidine(34) synthetase TilS [Candidatus Lambdaproteobacteria bacterium]|nr:tRNA lysidine(34) synthetase TilS [Candidatus Lambdaproteobacteria bacterium]